LVLSDNTGDTPIKHVVEKIMPVTVESILINQYKIRDIPVMTLREAGTDVSPIVFFLHGFTSDKVEGLSLGYQLARKGFLFVAFDAAMHGDRLDPKIQQVMSGQGDLVYPVESGLDTYCLMHEIILQTGEDLQELITYFESESAADTDRIGVTGFSMGGFATFYCAATNPKIQAAVPVAGIPAFQSRWEDVVLESSSYEAWADKLDQAAVESAIRTDWMGEIDPFHRMIDFYPKPLLMINGDLDTDSYKKYSVDLYRTLKPIYESYPDRLKLKIHDGVGHQLTQAMKDDITTWFEKFLKV
jgi:fermentation-respiration switch protein FrsA (DUF1100 family)